MHKTYNTTDQEREILDFLSNGFKLRTTDGGMNGSGMTGLYIAFAKFPFVSSNGIHSTAR